MWFRFRPGAPLRGRRGGGTDLIFEINNLLMDLVAGQVLGWESTCGIKVTHHTEQGARQHAQRLSGCRAYPCSWCLYWHVGHPLKRHFARNIVITADRNRRAA